MRKIVVFTNLTVDGVMQAPGSFDEDPRGGFQHGGWGATYGAMQSGEAAQALSNASIGPMLFGRRTYERFYSFWPKQTGSPFTEMLNNAQKYVASTTLKDPLPWQNSILLKGDAAQALADLKAQPGQDFMIMGSGELVQSLMKRKLVDLYVLLIHPLVLGSGRHLFPEGGAYASLKLIDARATSSGVVVATYQPTEPAAGKTASAG